MNIENRNPWITALAIALAAGIVGATPVVVVIIILNAVGVI